MYTDFLIKSTNIDSKSFEYVSFYSILQTFIHACRVAIHGTLISQGHKKTLWGITVLDGVDMDLERGKVYQLIGSNGSGKTTLVDIISGRLHPDEGSITLDGNDITHAGQL